MVALETLVVEPKKTQKPSLLKDKDTTTASSSFADFLQTLGEEAPSLEGKELAFFDQKTLKQDPKLQQKNQSLSLEELLSTPDETKTSSLEELLLSQDNKTTSSLQLNPELTQKLSPSELKYLIKKAKQYLKEQITTAQQSQKQLSTKELPNNLKSLLDIAQKLDIDISKISVEDLTKKNQPQFSLKQTKQEIQTQQQTSITKTSQGEKEVEIIQTITTKLEQSPKDISLIQTKQTQTVITTKEFIDSKTKKEQPQNKQPDLLSSLLSPQQEEKKTISPNADLFAVLQNETTSKQPKPQTTQEKIDPLEALLQPDNIVEEAHTLKTSKVDSFEVKIQEAKQMMRYLSDDIKRSIDDYKPPFTRVKVQLNPQKLGEIDLTVVQRGNNVHINLSSNNAAINILTNNLTELKTQLTQSGINNASFNFNSNSQQDQQGQQHKQQNAYEYFAKEETEEDLSLEIIIPQYV